MMPKSNVIRASKPKPKDEGDRLSVYADAAFGERVRDFCWRSRLTFSALANLALREFMDRHEPEKLAKPGRLPAGPRLKPKRF